MYISEIKYEFVVLVKENGEHFPTIRILDFGVPKILELLVSDEMQNLKEVEDTINELASIHRNKIKSDQFIFKKCYYLKVNKNRIGFYQESISEDYLELDFISLLDLIKDWKRFLEKYGNDKIPGIAYS